MRPACPARCLVGLNGYVTNLLASVMATAEVIAKYHDQLHVEKPFGLSRNDLRARPMFHYTRDAIEAQLTIVCTALVVSHSIQARTGLAILGPMTSHRILNRFAPQRNLAHRTSTVVGGRTT